MSTKNKPEATELEWLKYFYGRADFGPADGDVQYIIARDFEESTGKRVPTGYREGVLE